MKPAAPARIERTREVIVNGDVQIEIIAEGAGPLVIMLPSRGRDSEDFDEVAAGIAAAGYRVLRPQPRGIRRSTGPMNDLTLHDFADDVAAIIRDEGSGSAVLIGHAFGNQVARMTAVDHPCLVRGVVLAATAARNGVTRELADALSKAADLSLPDAVRLQALQFAFFAPNHDPSIWLTGWHPQTMQCQGTAIANTRTEEWWSAGAAPILDLQAALDPWRRRDTANELKDELGERVEIAIVGDASHALIPEQPSAVVEHIVNWTRQLPAGGSRNPASIIRCFAAWLSRSKRNRRGRS
jgi:pimeloyl-ACP methyl ester carboxylesterase